MRMEMKLEKMSQKALDRKNNKPIMEKKRRARINHCLNQLKALILETDNERSRHSKLEKADILEMTVKYLHALRTYHQLQIQQLSQIQQQQQQQQQQQPLPQAHQHQVVGGLPAALQHHFQQAQQHAAQLQLQLPLQLQGSQQSSPTQHSQISPAWRPW